MKKNDPFSHLVEVMDALRDEGGCPWDREQTSESLKLYLVEEAYEVLDAIDSGNIENLKEELGDLLIQILFHSRIAKEKGWFDIYDVAENVKNKLIQRHPHVFGDLKINSSKEVLKKWEIFKKNEGKTLLEGVPSTLPSLLMAYRVSEKVARVGFDWKNSYEVLEKIKEEFEELKEGVKNRNIEEIEEEVGDLFFSIVNICRFFNINPEETLRKMVKRFVDRFLKLEEELKEKGLKPEPATIEEMNEIWEKVKNN